jgi:hypothetical protein
MIIIGIKDGVVALCVSITPDQLQTVTEMYPEHQIMEQAGEETIGWLFDGGSFTPPAG